MQMSFSGRTAATSHSLQLYFYSPKASEDWRGIASCYLAERIEESIAMDSK
jgi:hypothetical protein